MAEEQKGANPILALIIIIGSFVFCWKMCGPCAFNPEAFNSPQYGIPNTIGFYKYPEPVGANYIKDDLSVLIIGEIGDLYRFKLSLLCDEEFTDHKKYFEILNRPVIEAIDINDVLYKYSNYTVEYLGMPIEEEFKWGRIVDAGWQIGDLKVEATCGCYLESVEHCSFTISGFPTNNMNENLKMIGLIPPKRKPVKTSYGALSWMHYFTGKYYIEQMAYTNKNYIELSTFDNEGLATNPPEFPSDYWRKYWKR